jgi:SAM-dependent methyltransferase
MRSENPIKDYDQDLVRTSIGEQQRHWDAKYERGLPSLEIPDAFFLRCFDEVVAPAFPKGGTALDLAGGLGRHALVLARARWQVALVDFSKAALRKVQAKASKEALTLDTFHGEASSFPFKQDSFDLAVLFYHLERELFPLISRALRPGGIFVSKLRIRWPESETESRQEGLLERNELPAMLPGFRLLHHRERKLEKDGVVELLAKKNSQG